MPTWISQPLRADNTGRTATTAAFDVHVRELIAQVLFTRPGERLMRPTFGSGLMQAVFEPAGAEMIATAQFLVQASLQQWLGDVITVESVTVEQEDSTVRVTVQYILRRTRERQTDTYERSL